MNPLGTRHVGVGVTTYNGGNTGATILVLALGAGAGWALGNYLPAKQDTTLVRLALAAGGAFVINYAASASQA